MSLPTSSLQLQSCVTSEGQLHLKLAGVPVEAPAAEEVVIRVEAAPINPSDIGAMIGAADISDMRIQGSGDLRVEHFSGRAPIAPLDFLRERRAEIVKLATGAA